VAYERIEHDAYQTNRLRKLLVAAAINVPGRVRPRPHVLPGMRARGYPLERRGRPCSGSRDPRGRLVFGSRPVSWYLRSMADRDTHRGELNPTAWWWRSAVFGVRSVGCRGVVWRCPVITTTAIRSAHSATRSRTPGEISGRPPVEFSTSLLPVAGRTPIPRPVVAERAQRRTGRLAEVREMPGKHRRACRWRWRATSTQPPAAPAAIEMVDARSLAAHRVTDSALAAGKRGGGHYVATCGQEVLPASLTEPPRGTCRSCTPIPSQRSRMSR